MAKRILKKIILVILVSPLLLISITARILADIFSEIDDGADALFTKLGRAMAKMLNIME